MKKLLVLAVLAISSFSFAQEKGHEGKRGEHHKRGQMEMMKDLSPEQMATLKTKKMTLALDLTESQQKKIYDLSLREATERKAKMEARKKEMENAKGKKPELSSDEKFKRANEKIDKQIAVKKELSSILTREQMQKLEEMKKRKMMKKKKVHMRKKAGM